MRSSSIGVGPKCTSGCPLKNRKGDDAGGGDEKAVYTGATQPQAEEHQEPPGAGRGRGGVLCLLTPSCQNYTRVNSVLSQDVRGNLLHSPRDP